MRKDEISPYELTRQAFVDVVWNRIGIIEFRSTSLYSGRIFPMNNWRDRFGRPKVWLTINADNPSDEQAQTLVHESIHVDRAVWEKGKGISSWSHEFYRLEKEEEELTENAANEFYIKQTSLAEKALYHVWRRRRVLKI